MKRILSIFLLFSFLVSHMGVAIGTHYCGGLAVETELMLGHKNLDCGMGMAADCETPSDMDTLSMNQHCCDNDYYSVEVEEDFQSSVSTADINIEFIAAFIVSIIQYTPEQELTKYAFYDPPSVSKDIPILHQVFII